jgi:nucleoside-diphosphate-sugar epimerase
MPRQARESSGTGIYHVMMRKERGDVPVTYADSSALQSDFGFTPKITLREGLRKFATWYKEYYG